MNQAELVEKRVGEVLDRHPRAAVDRAMPIILLLLARDCGYDNLRPRVQSAFRDLVAKLGVSEDMTKDETEQRIQELVRTADVDRALLKELTTVFASFDIGAEVEAEDRSHKLLGKRAAHESASKTTDEAPADSEKGSSFVANRTGRIGS